MASTMEGLFRKRKQDDRVKLEWWLWLAALICVGMAALHGIKLWQYLESPVEYELSDSGGITDADTIREQLEPVSQYRVSSLFYKDAITIRSGDRTISVEMKAVSGDYLKRLCEDITPMVAYGMPILYVNNKTYQAVVNMKKQDDVKYAETEELQCEYIQNDEIGIAKLVAVETGQEDAYCGYILESTDALQKKREGILLYCMHHDIDDRQLLAINDFGYQAMNENDLHTEELEKKLLWIQFRDLLAAGIMLGVFAGILRGIIRRSSVQWKSDRGLEDR